MRDSLNNANLASHITRLLILSYFAALALGLIQGAEIARLTAPFLPPAEAQYTIGITVLLLAFMVLVGIFRKPAALVLSLILFFSSYMTMFATNDLTGFWRDLALIGGLLMSAGAGEGWAIVARPEKTSDEEEVVVQKIISTPTPEPVVPTRRSTITRFREDLNLAREA